MKQIAGFVWIILVINLLSGCAQARTEWVKVDETRHFTFYAARGAEAAVPLLAKELEANYDRITDDLQMTPAGKFPFYVYADIDSYHQAIGEPNAPANSIGSAHGTTISLLSPLNPSGGLDTQAILTAGVHEFTHALVNEINGSLDKNNYSIPIWLNEGLAGYESGQMTPDWRARLVKLVADEAIPSIHDDLVPERYYQVKGLPFSITLVEYLVKQYGYAKIIEIIKTPGQLEAILGTSTPALDASWREYLHKQYR